MLIYLPLAVMGLGLILFLCANEPKPSRIGEILFFCGLLVSLFQWTK